MCCRFSQSRPIFVRSVPLSSRAMPFGARTSSCQRWLGEAGAWPVLKAATCQFLRETPRNAGPRYGSSDKLFRELPTLSLHLNLSLTRSRSSFAVGRPMSAQRKRQLLAASDWARALSADGAAGQAFSRVVVLTQLMGMSQTLATSQALQSTARLVQL
mmetsp:Transcript_15008/g.31232  ORF Transcript_15008/g.31232 Transcript_15008/m.31232 type:complete len:158 (+) Transcript_15008:691-1164(+)